MTRRKSSATVKTNQFVRTDMSSQSNTNRIYLTKNKLFYPIPNLAQAQRDSYRRFIEEDIIKIFDLINPITDNTGKLWSLEFIKPELRNPERKEQECLRNGLTYEAPLYWQVRLVNLTTGEAKEQTVFMGNIPLMTPRGTFIINGDERVIVHQIIRSEGVMFLRNELYSNNRPLHLAKIIPTRGAWFTIDTSKTGVISIKFGPRRPRINICTFLRAMGYSSDAEIIKLFADVPHNNELPNFIEVSLAKDPTTNTAAAIFDIYRVLRPDVTASLENAKAYIDSLLFDPRKLYLGDVGRYQLNKKLATKYHRELTEENYSLHLSDIIGVIEHLLKVNYGYETMDDVDHLGNRRIRSVNELLGEVVINAVKKIEKNTKDKMSLHSTDELLTANDVMSSRPLVTALKDFFGTSQISRFMSQKNVLAELSNLRHVTAGGPGGLTKERATFSVRDVHHSQYGRLCVVQTPEGTSIGVVNHLALFAKVNRFGFIEVPYRKVAKKANLENALNRIVDEDIKQKNKVVVKAGTFITEEIVETLKSLNITEVNVKPYLTGEIEYLDADTEDKFKISHALVDVDQFYNILSEKIPVRHGNEYYNGSVYEIDYVDVDPAVSAGVNFALTPFGNHTVVDRNLIEASNMNQAVPLVNPEPPIVGTGLESEIARKSGRSLYATRPGIVEYVDASKVVIRTTNNVKDIYELIKFQASNDNTLIHHIPRVNVGQVLNEGDLIADGASAKDGELAIGTNLLTACMFFDGGTFEDGFAISERVLKRNSLTGVLIKTYTRDIRETKLGPEILTADIPGVSESMLAKLDENGVVRKGTKVKTGDILAGIVAPKGDIDNTPEEKLLRSIFGKSASDVKNVSLTMPNGEEGIVIDTQILDQDTTELGTGVIKQVKIWVAKLHNINIGDKLCDLAGQKGVIAKIIPEADMPYLPDGTPVDIIFGPLFLKRMNVSLLREMHLGMKCKIAGVNVAVPLFSQIDESIIDEMIKNADVPYQEKYDLYDGRTGEKFDQKVAVGYKYILKITHIAEEKIHARSTGPYAVITQQPLGGKAQFGGQRFGEMEVWALEAHGAGHILKEMLTIKSDDIEGRSKAYEAIIHGQPIVMEGTPESFKVLISELRALGLNIRLMKANGEEISIDN
ncbi:MAG: DNA-directed RNA polymerase subunit beta [Candidatus Dojkabacteria bacterium]|nr:MAG: DNA-directed RNA polymerase subunit beta [Candidatus Dojkabacteria bacterium]